MGDKKPQLVNESEIFTLLRLIIKTLPNILRRRVATVHRSYCNIYKLHHMVMNVVRPHKVIVRLFVRGTN